MKSMHILRMSAILCIALLTQSLSATSLTISGTYEDLFTDVDTIFVDGNTTVNDSMIIRAGTRVFFNDDYELTVFKMYALGTLGDSIYFSPNDNLGAVRAGKLLVNNEFFYPCSIPGACATCQMEYCVFERLVKMSSGEPAYSAIHECDYADLLNPSHCSIQDNDTVKFSLGAEYSTVRNTDVFYCEPKVSGTHYDNFYLSNCIFESNASTLDISTEYLSIHHNVFRNNTATPLKVNTLYLPQTIANNLFHNNISTNGPGGLDLALLGSPTYVLAVFNNTFYANKGTQGNSMHFNGMFTTYLFNNIFWSSQPVQEAEILFEGNTVMSCSMFNSTVRGGMSGITMPAGYGFSFSNIYTAYPEFVDSLNSENLELQLISPAIDMGEESVPGHPSVYFGTDLKHNPRIYAATVDVGAYEYHPGAPVVTYVTADTVACLGDSLTLKAHTGDMHLYHWYKDGQLLFSDYQDKVYIVPFTTSDTGYYQAEISNADDVIMSDSIHLRYDVPPVITDRTSEIEACENESAELYVVVESAMPPTYEWYNSAGDLLPETSGILTIDPEQDAGAFWVNISTNCYSTGDTLLLSRVPAPKPNLGVDTIIFEGDSILLDPGTFITYSWSTGSNHPTIFAEGGNTIWVEVSNEHECMGRDTIIISLKPLGVNAQFGNRSNELLLYPNPASDIVYIETQNDWKLPYQINIYTEEGRLVLNKKVLDSGILSIQINDFDAGNYFILLQSDTFKGIGGFVVK